MSLLDIRHAKEALAWRLKEWGTEGNHAELAGSFIDDLVAKGWRMDAMREDRPQPPRASEACLICGRRLDLHPADHAPSTRAPVRADAPTNAKKIRADLGWPVRVEAE